jgi:predicted enzyme related to lactoylglutathione lyase
MGHHTEQETAMTTAASRIAITDVRTVGVPVTDQERALDFYGRVLGFETRVDAPFGGGRWIEVAPPGAVTTVALMPAQEGTATGVDTGVRFTTTDADADHAALTAAGVDVDEVLRYPGVPPMFSFRDPEGNTLYLVERL